MVIKNKCRAIDAINECEPDIEKLDVLFESLDLNFYLNSNLLDKETEFELLKNIANAIY